MTQNKTGGPAFPGPSFTQGGHANGHAMGMTLRDWFAGQALAGLLASGGAADWSNDAENAYRAADAMLAAREEKK